MDMTFLTAHPIAHRGLHDDILPENGTGAFLAAAELGYAIETDVRLTRDGVPVLFHDGSLARMCGKNLRVEDCSFSRLSAFPLARSKEKIPALSDLLARIDGAVPLLIELKSSSYPAEVYLNRIAKTLEGYRGQFAVQSFEPSYITGFRKLRPDIPCGILASAGLKKSDFGSPRFWRFKAHVVKHMSLNALVKPDFISYRFSDLPTKKTEKFKGVKLGWVVTSDEDEKYARKFTDNIIFEHYLPDCHTL